MQTQRVTFLTSPEHKAALDAFAVRSGQSVGNIVREATSRYLAQPEPEDAELAALVAEVNRAIPRMHASLDDMIETMQRTHQEIDASLRAAGIRK